MTRVGDRGHRPTVRPAIVLSPTEPVSLVKPEDARELPTAPGLASGTDLANLDETATETIADPGDLEPDDEQHRATLVLVAGPTPGQVYSLEHDLLIGREPNVDVIVDDSAVSRRHARVFGKGGNYTIEDLGSANGTLVNGQRVARRTLAQGDRIQLGPRVLFRFALLDSAEEKMHRQLFESSTRDPLTGAFNKKYVTERLGAEVAHAQRHRSSLELVVFDLDRFKLVNDQHGHLVGDTVLSAVAEVVHGLIRTEDVFARFGGEEFVLLTRDCDAAKLAERIRAALAARPIATSAGDLTVTVSLGAARLEELGPDATATALLDLADQRLLRAKRSGRNRVCSSD